MNTVMAFPDSEVASVVADEDLLRIRFAVAHLPGSAGAVEPGPGTHRAAAYAPGVELLLAGPSLLPPGPWHDGIGRLSDGELKVDGQVFKLLPLPFIRAGQVRLSLLFANGTDVSVDATRVEIRQEGHARRIEAFSC